MKAHIKIELEVNLSDEDTKLLDEGLKKNNMTFSYHVHKNISELLINEMEIEPEEIKEISINRID